MRADTIVEVLNTVRATNKARAICRRVVLVLLVFALVGEGTAAAVGDGQVQPGPKVFPYLNPVYPGDAPDPGLLRVGGRFYAAVTGQRVMVSDDLVHWEDVGPLFERLPAWVDPVSPDIWAPDLHEINGRYVLYFSGNERGHTERHMGIGVAWSLRPEGPYRPLDEPLVSGPGYRNIDPAVFRDDDGTLYLYWGSEGKPILVQQVAPDGLSLVGEPRIALQPVPFSRYLRLIEGPWVIKRGGYYYMFVSGSSFLPGQYAVSVARAASPLGPFEYYPGNPILQGNDVWASPGHNAVIQDDAGQDWIVYHGYDWADTDMGRMLFIDRLLWKDGWPVVENREPSTGKVANGPVWNTAAIPRVEVAQGAAVSASSHQDGHAPQLAVDGDRRTAWLPAAEDEGPWITVDLGRALRIARVELAFVKRADHRYVVEASLDGNSWEVLADRSRGSAYPYQSFHDALARYVRVRHLSPANAARGLRDLRIYAYQGVWLTEPAGTAPLTSPFSIAAHVDEAARPARVRILVDKQVLYDGPALPKEPVQSPDLADGIHEVVLEVVDGNGALHRHALKVPVANAQILAPSAGARLQGSVPVRLAAGYAPGAHTRAAVTLVPIESGEAREDRAVVLYEGAAPPDALVLDTTTVEDGAYDLRFVLEADLAASGSGAQVRSETAVRVVVRNWERLVDPFEPPVTSPWFGTQERKKTLAESEGWAYETGSPELFFGDRDRRVWRGSGPGHLIWEVPGVRRFRITLYVREVDLAGVRVSLSQDQKEWVDIPWQTVEEAEGPGGWRRVKLLGSISPELNGRYIRFSVQEKHQGDVLQIGEAEWLYPPAE